ncbi:P-loop containing nucleoside triphosphate hydrolase protein [Suillus lakei]|nr:P-loop containing nucleoside triphosphate hydrolase protein [Suillus lakei]
MLTPAGTLSSSSSTLYLTAASSAMSTPAGTPSGSSSTLYQTAVSSTISTPAGAPSSSSSTLHQTAASSNHTEVEEPPRRTDMCSVVIFGESGAGKSSLVNLIAGKKMAKTSCDAGGCTSETNVHEFLIRNESLKVKLLDTPGRSSSLLFVVITELDAGLDEGPRGKVSDEEARRILKELIRTGMKQGDIHLIVYCVRGERGVQSLCRNYEFIHSQVKGKVPIVLVVTCLESRKPQMEEWWRVNERAILNAGMKFAGHACVTTAMMTEELRKQSRNAVCKLIGQCCLLRKNIVLFGQTGAGKSSLVNLMAGKDVAGISNDLKPCTLHWQEYPIEFDDKSYKVFDTVGLEEPQLGIPQFLDAVENAYNLIQELERKGGIDLLLFCMRAGRLTTTLQTNYRLFHEFLCDKKVPIVVVITHLENEVGEMDAWWKRNQKYFRNREVHVAGHACITAVSGNFNFPLRHEESRATIRKLVKEFTADGQKQTWNGGDNLFVSFMRKLWELLVARGNRKPPRKKMVFRLTKRCGISPDVAKQLVDRIRNDEAEGAT